MTFLDEPATWGELAKPDEEFLQMAATMPRRFPAVSLDHLHELRGAWVKETSKDMWKLLEATHGSVSVEEMAIPMRDGTTTNRGLVFRPRDAPITGSPLVVWIHGGGFLFGNAEMEAPACIHAAQNYGCVALSLDYRMSPEAKFPTAWEDCWDALEWIAANAASFGADPSQGFLLGGNSSGGQLVGTLSHWARDKRLSPPLTGLYYSATSIASPEILAERYPSLYQSHKNNENGLSKKTVNVFVDSVRPDLGSDMWSPLIWKTGHQDLPKTYFQVCGMDIQRDDSLIYERVLRKEYGVETKVDVYPGLPHVFWFSYPGHSAVPKFYADLGGGIGWLLGRNV